ncbi:MAG: beta-ketoacyl-ACP synthase III [Acidimicrobiia bacterium]
MTGRAYVAGWGAAVPERVVTNADLEARLDTSDAWIVERTGIHERRCASPDDTTASLAIAAGSAAIKRAGLTPDAIDLLVVATATPEQPIPHTGAFVGEGIGLGCGSFDLGAGCAGFVYALVAGASMLTAGDLDHVLVVGAETLSRIVNPQDRSTSILFGDGAAGVVLGRSDDASGPGLIAWDLGCDGSATGLLEIRAGGSRMPTDADTLAAGDHYLRMAGQEVFRRAVRGVVDSAVATLARAGVDASEVDWFIPHQANLRIIEAARQRLGIPTEKSIVNIARYGNTSAASIPLALTEAADDERLQPGQLVLVSGFGAGMAWASALLRWGAP